MNNDKRILSFLALGLFLAALLLPFIIAIFARDELALGFAVVASTLALLFGILSWSERLGRVVTVSLGVLLCAAGATLLLLTTPMPWQVARARAEREQAIARHQRAIDESIRHATDARAAQR